ncbi:MAG: tRNA (adenosine(37)-N6)-dimethylallyltransferase MiaA [Acidobacteria bacterium]|nr:tRNA (adenosine(37)-N6)-dimethylallyltransferase MiaA [Acidobacteriota bacterium]MBK8146633.1 tRNA (adenosine(37)-N6)-dimethylallyltransferase MiaA [Acidobacteriota bacterium]MBK8812881.1 tRNA (adenosine(37)-N6)-dimethylallyltransferase MiaA [Acidobacteriota bacterium]
MSEPKTIFSIAGPTASGKTELGVALALRLGNGEVVNCDSVQIYRGIEIATAKPTEEEKRGVPHHLIDYVPPTVNYTSADWAHDAAQKIAEIEARGAVPILVGGTGFYLRTLLEPLFESPKTDPAIRRRLLAIKYEKGPEHLHKLLTEIDPVSAAKLFPRDYVRVTRALEVFYQTGTKISEAQPNRAEPPEFAARIRTFVLSPPREELYAKINARALIHFDRGLVDEVERLRASGVPDDTNALGAHGYRRVCEYLRGERDLASAIEKTQQDVRNYAKRQLTWFRKESGVIWLEGFGDEPRILDELLGAL